MDNMKVRYSYLPQQFAEVEEVFNGIKELLKTGAYTLGPQVAEFEQSFANLIGTKYAVGVGSGTDALKLGMEASGIGHGDEVITAANTFIATAGAINELGAKPVFADVTPYYTIDPAKIEAAITPRTKAIMPVHLTGEPVDMEAVMDIANKHNLQVVEDPCQAILCNYKDKNAGTWGRAAGFSLHPLKNLNVWGDAGVVVTSDDEVYEKLKLIRNHGMKNRDEIACFGRNSRLDTLQAIVGNWLIKQVHTITDTRIKNAERYDHYFSELSDVIKIPPRRKEARRVYHLYMLETINVQDREPLVEHLLKNGVDAKVHYPIPLYQQEGLKHLGYKPGDFPETDRQAKHIFTLPVDQHLSEEQMDFAIQTVKSYFKK